MPDSEQPIRTQGLWKGVEKVSDTAGVPGPIIHLKAVRTRCRFVCACGGALLDGEFPLTGDVLVCSGCQGRVVVAESEPRVGRLRMYLADDSPVPVTLTDIEVDR